MELGKIAIPEDRVIGSWRYAKGRLAARGDRLMNSDQMDRLFSLHSLRELDTLMQELGYRGNDFAEALAEGEAEDWSLLSQITPEAASLNCLLLFKDAHNVKACLRAILPAGREIEPEEAESYFLKPYRYSAARLLAEVARVLKRPILPSYDNQGELPAWIGEMISTAEQAYRKYRDSAEIDRACDQYFWQAAKASAEASSCTWFTEYLDLQRYLKNIEIMMRCRSLNLSQSYLESNLLPAPEEEQERLLSALKLSDNDLQARLFTGPLKALAPLAKAYSERGGAAYFTAIADHILLNKLAEANSGEGAEIILHYFLGREADRRALRVMHSAIENNFSEERRRQMHRSAVR